MGRLTYTTQEVQDRLDSVGQMVRPNLLDNAYFVGGGSQQGGAQFPINQRGATSYNPSGNCIDRWYKSTGTSATLNITSAGLAASGANAYLRHIIENKDGLVGKTLTCSTLTVNGGLFSHTAVLASGKKFNFSGTSVELGNINASYPDELFGMYVMLDDTVIAAKVEIGSTQTLAHWDDTTQAWVLNEIPNYQQELARCQRYFLRLKALSGTTTHFALAMGESTTSANAIVSLPVTMRAVPSASLSGTVNLRTGTTDYAVTSVSTNNHSENAVYLNLKAASGLSAGTLYAVRVVSGHIDLNAEL